MPRLNSLEDIVNIVDIVHIANIVNIVGIVNIVDVVNIVNIASIVDIVNIVDIAHIVNIVNIVSIVNIVNGHDKGNNQHKVGLTHAQSTQGTVEHCEQAVMTQYNSFIKNWMPPPHVSSEPHMNYNTVYIKN